MYAPSISIKKSNYTTESHSDPPASATRYLRLVRRLQYGDLVSYPAYVQCGLSVNLLYLPGIYLVCGAYIIPEWVENHTADELFMMIQNDKTVRSRITSDYTDAEVRRGAKGAIERWDEWVAEKNRRDAKFRVV